MVLTIDLKVDGKVIIPVMRPGQDGALVDSGETIEVIYLGLARNGNRRGARRGVASIGINAPRDIPIYREDGKG